MHQTKRSILFQTTHKKFTLNYPNFLLNCPPPVPGNQDGGKEKSNRETWSTREDGGLRMRPEKVNTRTRREGTEGRQRGIHE